MTHPTDYELERVATFCALAAKAMRETETFETGQSILDEAAAMLRACMGGSATKMQVQQERTFSPPYELINRSPWFALKAHGIQVASFHVESWGSEAACIEAAWQYAYGEPAPDARQEGWRAGMMDAEDIAAALNKVNPHNTASSNLILAHEITRALAEKGQMTDAP